MRTPVLSIFKVLDGGVGPHYFPVQGGYLGSTTDYDKAAQLLLNYTESIHSEDAILRWRVKVNTAPGVGESYTFQLHQLTQWEADPARFYTVLATITISDTNTEGTAADFDIGNGNLSSSYFCSVTRSAGAPVAQGKSSMVVESDGAFQVVAGQNYLINAAPTLDFQVFGNTMGVGVSSPSHYRRKFVPMSGTLAVNVGLQDPLPSVREFAQVRVYKNDVQVSVESTNDVGTIKSLGSYSAVAGDWFLMDGNLIIGTNVRVNSLCHFYPDTPDASFLASNIGGALPALNFSTTPAFISPAGDLSHSTVEADVSAVAPIGMALSRLLLALPSGPGGSKIVTATLRVNGADTALLVNLTGFQQFGQNVSDTVYVAAGDLLSIKLTTNGPSYSNSTFLATSMQAVAAVDSGDSYDVGSHLTGTETASYQVGSFLAPIPSEGKFSPYDVGSHLASVESYAVGSHLADEPQVAYNVQSRLQANLGDGEGWSGSWHLFDRA